MGGVPDALSPLWSALTAFAKSPEAWKLTAERRKHLAARVREFDAATVLRVAEWVRLSTHERAKFLRERGDVKTLLRPENFATYAALSAGWSADARTVEPARQPSSPPTEEAGRAWEWICTFVRTTRPGEVLPPPASAAEARARSALRNVPNGWQRVLTCDDFRRRALREEFTARWNDASGPPSPTEPPRHTKAPTQAPASIPAPAAGAERASVSAMREPQPSPTSKLLGMR